MIKAQTLKGFRDFLPKEERKRQYVIETLKKVFESYGFEPLSTPTLEYEEILAGKYGQEGDKLMYKFKDNGDRNVAMRYDQTVPLARVIAQYQNDIPLPFKRYQIQNVFRAENTQKGRYREFLQVDGDIIGVYSPLADAQSIAVAVKGLLALGFMEFKVLVNDRIVFSALPNVSEKELNTVVRSIDKLKKIGTEKVLQEMEENGIALEKAALILETIQNQKPTAIIEEIFSILKVLNINEKYVEFLPTLARGLDYYTGLIFEVEVEGYNVGSVAGGGRYDNLIGMFTGRDIPAVGFAFGFDRLMEAMEVLNLFPNNLFTTKVLVCFSTPDLQKKALQTSIKLIEKNINSDIYPDDVTMEKQLKYADKKGIPFVLIVNNDGLVLKDMNSGEQKEVTLENLPNEIKS